MSIYPEDIARITGGILAGEAGNPVSEIVIDSRRASVAGGAALFVALRGAARDGHSFIEQSYLAGIRTFLVEEMPSAGLAEKLSGSSFILVADTLEGLHRLASHKRENYHGKVISITGSNGKTIVKEWLSDLLASKATVVRSPRSYNSQTGVPLSVWKLDDHFRYGVFEAGMSMPGEIAALQKIIRPHLGIITNIGEAHQENFQDMEAKTREKLSLFIEAETIVYCGDHELIDRAISTDPVLSDKNLFVWSSRSEEADLLVRSTPGRAFETNMTFRHGEREFSARVPFTDRASIENISTVTAAMLCLGFLPEEIAPGLESLYPVAMRMEQKDGINGCILIEDYYNSDPVSLAIALEYLRNIPYKRKTLIVTDILQSSRIREELYHEVSMLCRRTGITRIIGIGEEIGECANLFPDGSLFFKTRSEFDEWFSPALFRDEAILIKGARVFKLEEVARLLERTVHQTRLEVNLNDVLHNLNLFRSHLKPGTAIMAMVKAFAYGAGPKDIAEWLNYNGIEYLAVAYTDEGISLREAGVTNRIMVMSPEEDSFRVLIANDLEPELYSLEIIRRFVGEAEKNGLQEYPVHIKLDTGMHRLGLVREELDEVIRIIAGTGSIKVRSVFSHLASAENPEHDDLTRRQVERFISMADHIEAGAGITFLRHLLNSSGIMRFPEYQFDMVRLGIGMYGIGEEGSLKLKPAVSFLTHVIQVREVEAGDGIGYGFLGSSETNRTIATVPVGYADGLSRLMGQGRGSMWIRGTRVPIIGNVCMDMCMLDVTGLDAVPGDDVEIFGSELSVEDVAELCGTIPYEILTGIPPRVKRVYLYE